MGNAAAVKRNLSVELLVSELGGVPGCKAYHTSILVGSEELYFCPDGIQISKDLVSHGDHTLERIPLGSAKISARAVMDRLAPHFAPGSYDLLKKNCNSFSDAALVILSDQRLDKRYRQMEQFGARFPALVTRVARGAYSPNPSAINFDLDRLCEDLRFGPEWATQRHNIGRDDNGGALKANSRTQRKELRRVHILPFKDTFELNFDHMFRTYILPHVQSAAVADPSTGTGLRPGDEFSANGGRVRFRVVACVPEDGGMPVESTQVQCEGEPIERTLLKSVTILPLESSMDVLAGITPAKLQSDFVAPFLEQHSKELNAGQVLKINEAKFRVVVTQPADGGGACLDTKINTTGAPAKSCATTGCDAVPVGKCREKTCKCLVCRDHAADLQEMSCFCPLHAPKQTQGFSLSRFLPGRTSKSS